MNAVVFLGKDSSDNWHSIRNTDEKEANCKEIVRSDSIIILRTKDWKSQECQKQVGELLHEKSCPW